MSKARLHRVRSAMVSGVSVAAFVLVSLTLSQCRNVGERLTGLDALRSRPTTCIKQCNDRFKVLFDEEQKLHRTNVENCQMLPQPQKGECLVAEDARHTARKQELGEEKTACQNACAHRQGSGGP